MKDYHISKIIIALYYCKLSANSLAIITYTAWKVSKYSVFSGPYLDTFHTVTVLINEYLPYYDIIMSKYVI